MEAALPRATSREASTQAPRDAGYAGALEGLPLTEAQQANLLCFSKISPKDDLATSTEAKPCQILQDSS